jgi:hypothetical protein
MRDDLHEKNQARTFREKKGTPLPITALIFFIVAVLLTFVLGFAVTSKELLIGNKGGGVGHLFLKFAMTGCLILVFAFFSLASGLMAVYEFGIYAEERTPDPIYLNEQLMLRVVLNAVKQQIGNGETGIPIDDLGRPMDAQAKANGEVELFMREMARTPEAGMTLQLYQRGKLRVVGKDKKEETLLEEKGWLVEADLWARVRKVVEHGERTTKLPKPEKKEEEVPKEDSKALVPSGL